MFNIGDLVKHSIYKCYGIIINKDQRTKPWARYYITWVEDKFSPQSWERKEDLIIGYAKVNDEQPI